MRGFELFKEADAAGRLGPDDLEAMGEAAWWAMRADDAIGAFERAYAGYVEAHDNIRAAHVALTLNREHGAKLAGSVATSWFNRAQRILESEPEGPEHGYLFGPPVLPGARGQPGRGRRARASQRRRRKAVRRSRPAGDRGDVRGCRPGGEGGRRRGIRPDRRGGAGRGQRRARAVRHRLRVLQHDRRVL